MTRGDAVVDGLKARATPVVRGLLYEEFTPGRTFRHHWGRTITESDNSSFVALTLSYNPLYFNREYVRAHGLEPDLCHPMLAFLVAFGLSVEDLSELGGPFLGVDRLRFHRRVRVGETITANSTVISRRLSRSRPDTGIVTWLTRGWVGGELALSFERTNLVVLAGSASDLPSPDHPAPGAVSSPEATVPADWEVHRSREISDMTGDTYAETYGIGSVLKHQRGKTITAADHTLLTHIAMNTAQDHFNEHFVQDGEFKSKPVFGGVTASLVLGLATQDTAETALWESELTGVRLHRPVFEGTTVYACSELIGAGEGPTPDTATRTWTHYGLDAQDRLLFQGTRSIVVKRASHWSSR
ncbi:MaoC family dehydratase [Streptomyces sp. SID8352]|uniref:MaoC family dehydratase n=1 Tax=Streptomyces sp. SID8352 TaxID=2690338 RepID=UPI00136A06BC|nr:MaoC family dehydratase [Streptomyces sp. SID8352]MYU22594.1 hypothetical protein [Streptomyces sp. SID8352]